MTVFDKFGKWKHKKRKKIFQTISFIIFWKFLMFYQIFFPHKWNDRWLLLLNMVYTSFARVLLFLAENSWKTEIKLFLICLISQEKIELVSNIFWIIVSGNFFWFELASDSCKFNCLNLFDNPKPFCTVLA